MDKTHVQEVVDELEARMNKSAILRAGHTSYTLCVDGTSATGKTTILQQTGLPVAKIQHMVQLSNINTYFPSTIGYVAQGHMTENCSGPHLNDRSFLNPLEWHVLWRVMGDWNERVGNVRPSRVTGVNLLTRRKRSPHAPSSELLGTYRRIFGLLRDSYFYRHFRERINAVAIVDSDSQSCDERRRRRGSGSDKLRSELEYYTELQNLMYSELYADGACIDLAWFGRTPFDIVTQGIAVWLRDSIMPKLARGSRQQRFVPLPSLRLPVAQMSRDEPLLANACTHVSRTMARASCSIYVSSRLKAAKRQIKAQMSDLRSRRAKYDNVSSSSSSSGNPEDDCDTKVQLRAAKRQIKTQMSDLGSKRAKYEDISSSSSSDTEDDCDAKARLVAANLPAWVRCDTPLLPISRFQRQVAQIHSGQQQPHLLDEDDSADEPGDSDGLEWASDDEKSL